MADLVVFGVDALVDAGGVPQAVDGVEDGVAQEEADGEVPYDLGGGRQAVRRDEGPGQHRLAAHGDDKSDVGQGRHDVVPEALRHHRRRRLAGVRRPQLLEDQPEGQVHQLHGHAPHDLDVAGGIPPHQRVHRGRRSGGLGDVSELSSVSEVMRVCVCMCVCVCVCVYSRCGLGYVSGSREGRGAAGFKYTARRTTMEQPEYAPTLEILFCQALVAGRRRRREGCDEQGTKWRLFGSPAKQKRKRREKSAGVGGRVTKLVESGCLENKGNHSTSKDDRRKPQTP
ncbi:hypothetical protein CGRA01v4_03314 [Colletotrichum graminicola]|nr:hypothetical protein CGRA01v4_03314 [Colletotrichum graminicola]